ncbi:hypothetical protein GOP47_0013632 [Adiantum capillus-veneris]|uniref:Uncharacterized protein n=1 Tax=Adiantum capillus-veneris TaxID=13818 RepID=A0A9D4ZFY9_ADICA|nr:hypothetical protein GOP47_0013632 [Adiantum capillus-veneris]
MEQAIFSQAQFSLTLPCQSINKVHGLRRDLQALRVSVLSATNASMLNFLEEGVHAPVSFPINSLHMATDNMSSFSTSFRSSNEDDEMERFFLFCDNEPFHNDDDQDCLQNFCSIEDLNDHLFRAWWDNVSHSGARSLHSGVSCVSKPQITETHELSTNGFMPLSKNEKPVLQFSPSCNGFPLEKVEMGEMFLDRDDGISIVQVLIGLESISEVARFQVLIPKRKMTLMPPSPNDLVLPPESAPDFSIKVRLTDLHYPQLVDSCIDWLLQDDPDGIALVCKHGIRGSLSLIQLSAHERCVLIKVGQPVLLMGSSTVSLKLRALMSDRGIIKVGVNIQKDALALYYFLGITTNNCMRISQFAGTKRRKSLLDVCRELYQWDWSEKKKVCCSNWTLKELSLEQVRYAVLDAWTTRLVWIGQTEFWHMQPPSFSLSDLPWMLLDYFGRAVFCFEAQTRKDEDTTVEIKGARFELYQGYLSLKQKNFRSRVMGQKSVVEIHFKDNRKPQKYATLYREGSRVVLDNAEPLNMVKSVENLLEEISMISKVLVDNSNNCDVQKQKLEESLYVLLCIPGACPRHILVALGCLHKQSMIIPSRSFSLQETVVQNCRVGLNPGQLEAWQHMLVSPLSAVVGPPGTGKTTVIAAVARAWLQMVSPGETLICAAHQNVAVRHMAETLVKERIPGLLLLVSEDFYVGWHEEEYIQDVRDALVVSGPQNNTSMSNWLFRNGNAPPRIVLCTLSLIGNDSFHASLMGNRVSSMIIDECSQAAEGSLIPALGSLPHLQMLSVVGDPCQLPPYGLRPMRSVFDLLAQSCHVRQLQEQYRMPYRIAQFVSAEFYGGRLRTDPNKRWKDSASALVWVNIRGAVDTTAGTSLSNQEEAEAVVDWCKAWKKINRAGPSKGKVVVLTLYEAQRSLISGMLGDEGMGEEGLLQIVDELVFFCHVPNGSCFYLEIWMPFRAESAHQSAVKTSGLLLQGIAKAMDGLFRSLM